MWWASQILACLALDTLQSMQHSHVCIISMLKLACSSQLVTIMYSRQIYQQGLCAALATAAVQAADCSMAAIEKVSAVERRGPIAAVV